MARECVTGGLLNFHAIRFCRNDNNPSVSFADSVSLRLGPPATLTVHRTVIHYRGMPLCYPLHKGATAAADLLIAKALLNHATFQVVFLYNKNDAGLTPAPFSAHNLDVAVLVLLVLAVLLVLLILLILLVLFVLLILIVLLVLVVLVVLIVLHQKLPP